MRKHTRPGSYVNQSAAPASERPRLEPVICPRPVFENVGEKLMFEYAVESTPRRAGEPLWEWMGRVAAAAKRQKEQAASADSTA